MALADTARLIASLELQDKFTGTAKRAEGSISGLDRKMSTLSASGQKLGTGLSRAFSTIAKIGVGVAAGGAALLAVNIRRGIESLNELENVTAATNTVLESTNAISGQTAAGVRALAEEYESLNATMDDKVIQSGANMLLTFTNIRTKAFEPALEAALNMNEAMGSGPEGFQSTIIQVGKALNDPIKGVTALRRVGVQLSKSQEEQIKKLVEQNDLYGAQQVILGELTTQFGGRFAAAGDTAEGSMARLGDAVEDLQQRLAGPLLPVIDRLRERLGDFLGSKQVQNSAEELGEAIAGIFTNKNIERGVAFLQDALQDIRKFAKGGGEDGGGFSKIASSIGTIATTVGGLPWESIGNAAKLLGTGSKALLDAFLGLPPWVQTAVLTGWGLNKLTGGALGGIVGELSKGLIKGVLGITAGTVVIKAGAVTGGSGIPAAGGGAAPAARGLGGLVKTAVTNFAALAAIPLTVIAVDSLIDFTEDVADQAGDLNTKIDHLDRNTLADVNESLAAVDKGIAATNEWGVHELIPGVNMLDDTVRDRLEAERKELITTRMDLARRIVGGTDATSRLTERVNATSTLEREAARAIAAADATRIQGLRDSHEAANAHLAAIERKPTSFRATVNVTNNVGVEFSATAAAIQIRRVTQSTGTQQDFESLQ